MQRTTSCCPRPNLSRKATAVCVKFSTSFFGGYAVTPRLYKPKSLATVASLILKEVDSHVCLTRVCRRSVQARSIGGHELHRHHHRLSDPRTADRHRPADGQDDGVLCGVSVAQRVLNCSIPPSARRFFKKDGETLKKATLSPNSPATPAACSRANAPPST